MFDDLTRSIPVIPAAAFVSIGGRALRAAACCLLIVQSARAQSCDSVPVARIGSLSGLSIASLDVATTGPDKMPGAASALAALHMRTGKETIRR